MAFPELLILRHGETEWNLAHRMQGHLDSPLTTLGLAQAARQRMILDGFDLAKFSMICSPLGRTRATAEIAIPEQFHGKVTYDHNLREIDVGSWAGKLRSELIGSRVTEFTPDGPLAKYDSAPGGEGFEGLAARCTGFLGRIKGPHVLVTHGVTSRMIRAIYLGLHPRALGDLPGGQGVVFHMKDGTQKRIE